MQRHGLQAQCLRCHNLLLQLFLGMELRSKTHAGTKSLKSLCLTKLGSEPASSNHLADYMVKKLELHKQCWLNESCTPSYRGLEVVVTNFNWCFSIRSGSNDTYQMIFFAFSERSGITAADVWWLLYQSNSETARDYIHQWFNWSQTASEEKKSVAEGQHRITFPGRLRPQCQDYGQASSDYISVFTFICQTQVCAQKYVRSYSASQTSWPQCSMLAISDSKTETLPLRCKWAMKIQLGSCTYGATQQWKWNLPHNPGSSYRLDRNFSIFKFLSKL